MTEISRVTQSDLEELLPLMRAYCDFYEVDPPDDALLALSRALLADPAREGVQLIARHDGEAVGFATIYWSWATTIASRIGVMNDLYVAPTARGSGAADELILACLEECRQHGAVELTWIVVPPLGRRQEQETTSALARLRFQLLDQCASDPAAAVLCVDDERGNPGNGTLMLDCGRHLQVRKPHGTAVELGDDDTVTDDRQALEPGPDRARLRGIAQLCEQSGDRLGVGSLCVPDRQTHGSRL